MHPPPLRPVPSLSASARSSAAHAQQHPLTGGCGRVSALAWLTAPEGLHAAAASHQAPHAHAPHHHHPAPGSLVRFLAAAVGSRVCVYAVRLPDVGMASAAPTSWQVQVLGEVLQLTLPPGCGRVVRLMESRPASGHGQGAHPGITQLLALVSHTSTAASSSAPTSVEDLGQGFSDGGDTGMVGHAWVAFNLEFVAHHPCHVPEGGCPQEQQQGQGGLNPDHSHHTPPPQSPTPEPPSPTSISLDLKLLSQVYHPLKDWAAPAAPPPTPPLGASGGPPQSPLPDSMLVGGVTCCHMPSPTSSLAVTGTATGGVLIWDLDPGHALPPALAHAAACRPGGKHANWAGTEAGSGALGGEGNGVEGGSGRAACLTASCALPTSVALHEGWGLVAAATTCGPGDTEDALFIWQQRYAPGSGNGGSDGQHWHLDAVLPLQDTASALAWLAGGPAPVLAIGSASGVVAYAVRQRWPLSEWCVLAACQAGGSGGVSGPSALLPLPDGSLAVTAGVGCGGGGVAAAVAHRSAYYGHIHILPNAMSIHILSHVASTTAFAMFVHLYAPLSWGGWRLL